MEFEDIVYTVDPDQSMSRSLAALLASYKIKVRHFPDAESFLAHAATTSTENSCVLIEFELPGLSSLALLSKLLEQAQCPPLIVLGTGVPRVTRQQVRDAGATDFVDKPLAAAYVFHGLSDVLPGAGALPHTTPSVQLMEDGTEVTFRMMRPEDAEMEQAFVVDLSDRSRYLRFFSGIKKLPASVLETFTNPEFPYSYAVIAVIAEGAEHRQVGVARYAPTGTDALAEFAVVIADDWQGRGIGRQLMRLLILAASVGGIQRLEGLILKENVGMLALATKLGFTVSHDHDAGPSVALYVKDLRGSDEQEAQ